MTHRRSQILAMVAVASLTLGWGSASFAQAPAKDEGLDKLLEKIDDSKGGPAKESDKDKEKDAAKPKSGEVAPADEGLDKLLKGLGETKDTPAPEDKKPGGGGGDPNEPSADKPMPKPDDLQGEEQKIDEEFKRILGKKEKPKKERDKKEGEGAGALGDVIKEMRDVEERLGKPDTGEETRKKQGEIVKNLDTLIEQLKNAPGGSQGMKMIRQGKKPGQPQPGQPGDQPGAMADGAPQTKPEKPRQPPVPIEVAKALWGQLPAQYREGMGNVLNENPLPNRADLIRLYYLSLGKKSSNRGE